MKGVRKRGKKGVGGDGMEKKEERKREKGRGGIICLIVVDLFSLT